MTYTTINQNRKMQEIQVDRKGKKLTFLTEVTDMGRLLQGKWLRGFNGRITFPLYEGATFHFGKGRIYLFLQDPQGQRLFLRDATCKYSLWESTMIFGMLTADGRLWRTIVSRMDPAVSHGMAGCGPELLPAVTRFPGFQRSFYDVIPYGTEETIPASFRAAAKQLRSPKLAKEFFLQSKLPKCKSIRKAFFHSPQLMFYLPEHEIIYGILEDVNLYRMFLESTGLFDVLSALHQRPVLEVFLRDYAQVCGRKALLEKLRSGWRATAVVAIDYCTLNEEDRKMEQKRWPRAKIFGLWRNKLPGFSIPMAYAEGLPDSYTVNGFTFRRLRTSREYARTGQQMNNCLSSWSASDNPVFCIQSRSGNPVGAVEVEGRTVIQVRGRENKSIFLHPGLFEAYRQWIDAVGLVEDMDLELRDFEDDLPF